MRTSPVGVSKFPCPHSHVNFAESPLIRNVSITQTRFSGFDLTSRSLSIRRRTLCNEEVGGRHWGSGVTSRTDCDQLQIRSKDSQVKTQLVLWIFILFKVTR